ncbi:MAG: SDR family oxidoreductase [Acidobacteriia bacterium]|nr:SDR family oxidoreductase [Terriglobia bacterium]
MALARSGVQQVVIHYHSHRKGAEQTLAAVREAGADGVLVCADLTTSCGIHCLIQELDKNCQGLDILINNAGALIQRAPLLDYPEELFDRVMTLNAKSVWFLTKAVVPHMLRNSGGVIVNVTSIAARTGGSIGAVVYAAAKAAVSAMTKGMARELAPKGIRVNAISPGTVDNHFHEAFSNRKMLDSVVAATPAGRLGTDEDMADAIIFLCSQASRYIHGQTIELNGGFYMV